MLIANIIGYVAMYLKMPSFLPIFSKTFETGILASGSPTLRKNNSTIITSIAT